MSKPYGTAGFWCVLALFAGLTGCATDGSEQLTSAGSSTFKSTYAVPSSSIPPVVVYSYTPGPVDADVDESAVSLRPFGFSLGANLANAPIFQLGNGCDGDTFGNRAGSVVVVAPGGCPIDSKYANAVKADAAGLLVAEVAPLDEKGGQWSSPPLTLTRIPVLFSTSPDSADLLMRGHTVSIQFVASVGEGEN